jgi:hypothetical protein
MHAVLRRTRAVRRPPGTAEAPLACQCTASVAAGACKWPVASRCLLVACVVDSRSQAAAGRVQAAARMPAITAHASHSPRLPPQLSLLGVSDKREERPCRSCAHAAREPSQALLMEKRAACGSRTPKAATALVSTTGICCSTAGMCLHVLLAAAFCTMRHSAHSGNSGQ